MQQIRLITLAILLSLPGLSHADRSLFDKGFALGMYSSLEWISQPLPVNFDNTPFHSRIYQLRHNQANHLVTILKIHLPTVSDTNMREALEASLRTLRRDMEKIYNSSSPWVTKCLNLNMTLEDARTRQLKLLVSQYEDVSLTENGRLDYQLEPEDLSGYFYGLQILSESQTWGAIGLRDPNEFTLYDLWYLTEGLSGLRKTLIQRMDASLLTAPSPALNPLILALGSEPIQNLQKMTSTLVNQWRAGNNRALLIEPQSSVHQALIVQFKVLYATYKNVAHLINDEHRRQTQILKISIKSCAALLAHN